MPFRAPRFNITCTIWRGYGPPFLPRAPGGVDTLCQLRTMRTALAGSADIAEVIGMLILLPKLTDVQGGFGFGNAGAGQDVIECPRQSGRFYRVTKVEDAAKGFDNEYRIAVVQQAPLAVPFPIP